jgi:cysteine desulfurase
MMKYYFDNNASCTIDPEVRAAMLPLLEQAYGNPSNNHWAGAPAKKAVEQAREKVAEFLGAKPEEIVFTSGGSESNNLALKGAWYFQDRSRKKLVISAIEHPSIIQPAKFLERQGAELSVVGVDSSGTVEFNCEDGLLLASVMHANNEVGTIQPIAEISEQVKSCGGLMHVDACQSAGKINVNNLPADMITIAGHKLHAPKGIGALFVKSLTPIEPLIHGVAHEHGLRAGTESALLAVALGTACEVAQRKLCEFGKVKAMRDLLWQKLVTQLRGKVQMIGHPENRLPNTLSVSFLGKIGGDILARCPDLAASTGAACHSGTATMTATQKAIGLSKEVAYGVVRLSLGHNNTEEEVSSVANMLIKAMEQ